MQLYAVLVMALAAGARTGKAGGFRQTIRNGPNPAASANSEPYKFTTPEMVPYTVDRNVTDEDGETILYEQRTYPAQKWVCTRKVIDGSERGNGGVFMRLFRYIAGTNEEGQTVPMTSPVSMMRVPVPTEVTTNEDGEEEQQQEKTEFTMCFYINEEFQDNPPTPNNGSEVFIEERPTTTVIANRIGGFMSEDDWKNLAKKLKEDSEAMGETGVDYSRFYRAGYDSPWKLLNRRNEVWYVKTA